MKQGVAAKRHKNHKMKTRERHFNSYSFLCLLCFFVATAASAFSSPPAITYLHPAGAQRGTTAEVTAAGTFDPWPAKAWVSGTGVSAVAGKTKGTFAVTVDKDATPGVYWLRAFNDDGASSVRPFVVGTLPEVSEKEPNDDFKKPQSITGDVTVNGKLEKAGDVDCFAVSLKKGQTLVASLEANDRLRSPIDAILQLVSADGTVLEENHDFRGLDPQFAFTAAKDGTYVVRVFAFPSQPDSSIRFFGSEASVYRLTLTTGPFGDYPALLAQTRDDLRQAAVEGWNLPAEAPKLSFATGLSDDPFAVAFAPQFANPLRVRLEPHKTFGQKITDPLKPPFSFTGGIERGEAVVPFAGKKGQALTIQVESRSLGLAVNPVVRVLDAEKKQLARAEPAKMNGDTTLSFTPTADGTFSVAVSDLFGGSGKRFAFLLRVLSEPDYDLTVPTDRVTLAPGKPATIPVKVNRARGFTKAVEVSAEGLPEGVKLEVTQPAKPDPNTITLSLTTEQVVSGPFRLVGKVKDTPAFTRHARAPLAEFEDVTADLWLTPGAAAVVPKKKKN